MDSSSDQISTKAKEYFAAWAPCSEAVLHALQEAFELPENIVAGAVGFGGGIGRCQTVCGAISGAVIALSHHAAMTTDTPKDTRDKARNLANELFKSFEAKFDSTSCRVLTDWDFQEPGGYESFHKRDVDSGTRFCNPYVEYAAIKAVEIQNR
jgi:C_GCAxxG_C_C family probable redox protein